MFWVLFGVYSENFNKIALILLTFAKEGPFGLTPHGNQEAQQLIYDIKITSLPMFLFNVMERVFIYKFQINKYKKTIRSFSNRNRTDYISCKYQLTSFIRIMWVKGKLYNICKTETMKYKLLHNSIAKIVIQFI